MRRARAAAALLSVLVLAAAAVTGCAKVAGDGKLTNDWTPLADAKPIVPAVGACYTSGAKTAGKVLLLDMPKVPCDQPHALETYHVGQFPASIASPPDAGDPEHRKAFAACEAAAKEFLGDHWYLGRLHMMVIVASPTQWQGEARHYRCDLIEVKSQAGEVVTRTSSARDGLRAARPLANACSNYVGARTDAFDDLVPADCAQPHDAEFVGVYETGDTRPDGNRAGVAECKQVAAAYLGGTADGIRVGWAAWAIGALDWLRGDRRIRCYATAPTGKKLKSTVKGIGDANPPTAG
jgi:putative regulator of septum formation